MILWLTISAIIVVAYWAGWTGCRLTSTHQRLRDMELAEEMADDQYERGVRDGFEEGVKASASHLDKVIRNQAVCFKLGEKRFAAGGKCAHE